MRRYCCIMGVCSAGRILMDRQEATANLPARLQDASRSLSLDAAGTIVLGFAWDTSQSFRDDGRMHDKSTRQHIIESADQLFYRLGFEHTSFATIADAVQISRGNFYHHFKSKDEILSAVIRHRVTR